MKKTERLFIRVDKETKYFLENVSDRFKITITNIVLNLINDYKYYLEEYDKVEEKKGSKKKHVNK